MARIVVGNAGVEGDKQARVCVILAALYVLALGDIMPYPDEISCSYG